MIESVIAPLLHVPPMFPERTTLSPVQNEVAPLAVFVEGTGSGFWVVII